MTKEDYMLMYIESPEKLKKYIKVSCLKTSENLRQALLELGDPRVAAVYGLKFGIYSKDEELVRVILSGKIETAEVVYWACKVLEEKGYSGDIMKLAQQQWLK